MKLMCITATVLGICTIDQSYAAETFTFLGAEPRSYEYTSTSTVDSWGTDQTGDYKDSTQLVRFHRNTDGSVTRTVYAKSYTPDLKPASGGATFSAQSREGIIEQVWPLQNGTVLFAADVYTATLGESPTTYLYKLNLATGTVGNNPPLYDNQQAILNMGERNNVPQTDIRALHHRSLLESSLKAPDGSNILFYGEYNISRSQPQVGLWKSTNSGNTWTKVIEWNTVGHQTRHIHAVVQNPYNKWIYILFGDADSESAIVSWDGVSAAPPDNTPLDQIGAKNANGQPVYPGWRSIAGSQAARAADLVFTPATTTSSGKCIWVPDVDWVASGAKLFGQRANYDLTGLEAGGEIPYTNDFPPILGAYSNTGNIYWISFRIDSPTNEKKFHIWKSTDAGLNWLLAGKADNYTSWTTVPQNLRVSGVKTATETTDTLLINGRDVEFVVNGQKTGSSARFSSKTTQTVVTPPPVTTADTATTLKGQAVAINVVANDTNAAGSTVNAVTQPAHGSISIASGVITYTPAAGYVGTDSFTYNLSNGTLISNTSTVTITVNDNTSTLPVANPDTATTTKGQAVIINATANDTNATGSTLNIATQAAHGSLAVNAGSITYTPAAGYVGQDSFTYNLSKSGSTSNTATVTITVNDNTSTLPVANSDTATTTKGQAVIINATANDTNATGSTLNIATQAAHGSLAVNAGSITYTPAAGYVGQDSFTYNLSKSGSTSNTATVTITVTDITGTLPVANPDTVIAAKGQNVIINLTANDTNVGNSIVNIVSYPDFGNLTYTDSTRKSITYTPPSASFTGLDSFTYNLKSTLGTSNTAAVDVTVR